MSQNCKAVGDLDRITALERMSADLRRAQQLQSERLAEARARAEAEKRKTLAAEPWSAVVTAVPTVGTGGELTGILSMPVVDAKELFGGRLAYDLLGCCDGEDQVRRMLVEYFAMIREPEHAFLVAFTALKVIASYAVPVMLDSLECHGGDYESRVRLADAALNAWATRMDERAGVEP
ncbi:hypothetical protein [Mycobacterium sp. pW045]|uniref:hypothetical protein n=1 Tax=Mycobacterium sp. pW045 TaxID=3238984 RepID=UPI00351AD4A3